jgi:hypothetical protein
VFLRVEAAREHDLVAQCGADDPVAEPGRVEERGRDQHRAAAREGDAIDQLDAGERSHLGARRALRKSGGAAGEDGEATRSLGRRRDRGVPGGDQVVQDEGAGRHGVAVVHPGEDAWERGWQGVQQVVEFAVVQHGPHAFACGDLGELRFGEAGVHQGQPQSGAAGCADRQDQAAVVAGQDTGHRARRQSHGEQGVGQGVGLLVEFAIGQHPAFVGERRRARSTPGHGHDHRCRGAVDVVVPRRSQGEVRPGEVDDTGLVQADHRTRGSGGVTQSGGERIGRRRHGWIPFGLWEFDGEVICSCA